MMHNPIESLKNDIRRLDKELEEIKSKQSIMIQNLADLQLEHYKYNKEELKL